MSRKIHVAGLFSMDKLEPERKEPSFCCPECGGSELNQIVTGIRCSKHVYGVYEDGTLELGELSGPIDNEDDGVFYECVECIYQLEDGSGNLIRTEHDLVKWFKENCKENMSNAQ
jgi:hypothetical protein